VLSVLYLYLIRDDKFGLLQSRCS